MLEFILTLILFFAIGGALAILARALPRVAEEAPSREPILDRLLSSGIPERIDRAFENALAKFLRKTRIVLLKMDNATASMLKKVKTDGNGKPPIDFSSIVSEKNGADQKNSSDCGDTLA